MKVFFEDGGKKQINVHSDQDRDEAVSFGVKGAGLKSVVRRSLEAMRDKNQSIAESDEELKQAKAERDEALKEAKAKRDEALKEAKAKRDEALEEAKAERDEALEEAKDDKHSILRSIAKIKKGINHDVLQEELTSILNALGYKLHSASNVTYGNQCKIGINIADDEDENSIHVTDNINNLCIFLRQAAENLVKSVEFRYEDKQNRLHDEYQSACQKSNQGYAEAVQKICKDSPDYIALHKHQAKEAAQMAMIAVSGLVGAGLLVDTLLNKSDVVNFLLSEIGTNLVADKNLAIAGASVLLGICALGAGYKAVECNADRILKSQFLTSQTESQIFP